MAMNSFQFRLLKKIMLASSFSNRKLEKIENFPNDEIQIVFLSTMLRKQARTVNIIRKHFLNQNLNENEPINFLQSNMRYRESRLISLQNRTHHKSADLRELIDLSIIPNLQIIQLHFSMCFELYPPDLLFYSNS